MSYALTSRFISNNCFIKIWSNFLILHPKKDPMSKHQSLKDLTMTQYYTTLFFAGSPLEFQINELFLN